MRRCGSEPWAGGLATATAAAAAQEVNDTFSSSLGRKMSVWDQPKAPDGVNGALLSSRKMSVREDVALLEVSQP